ncbi:50S ribosomal protein L18 [Candidatus Peregrinibacteria bacterium]|nr:50S ribosomal protein L18 [Candidatus Peregrinibacteria bacterium]
MNKQQLRQKRHTRIRSKVIGSAQRPRLLVFRSLTHTYAQLVDDNQNRVITGTSDIKLKDKGTKTAKAKNVGMEIAKLAKEKKIDSVVFDRGGYKYHGRVKALAEGAREGGLKF